MLLEKLNLRYRKFSRRPLFSSPPVSYVSSLFSLSSAIICLDEVGKIPRK